MAETLDLDIILKIGEIATIAGSVAVALFAFGRTSSRIELTLKGQDSDIGDIKQDLKKLNEIVIAVALQDQRLNLLAERLNRQDERWDEMRHGKGFVVHREIEP